MLKSTWRVVRMAAVDWVADRATTHAAAISYYAIFSLAPLLVVSISIAGTVFGEAQARGEVFAQVNRFLNNEAVSRAIEELVRNAARPHSGRLATALSLLALGFGASAVFRQIKSALNQIWEVERDPESGLVSLVLQYATAIAMVLAVGGLLLVLLAASSALSAATTYAADSLPVPDSLLRTADWVASIVVLTLLFAAIHKLLPDVDITWRDVWVGATVTSVLFTVGKFLIGWYLVRSSVASVYGAAGSFVLILVWTYYSSMIFLFGAEVTQAFARLTGVPVRPAARARFSSTATKPGRAESSSS